MIPVLPPPELAAWHTVCTFCGLSKDAQMSDDAYNNLSEFLSSLDQEGEQKFELSHAMVIICPDCGKNIAFRNRCPKCGGNSWIPAGHAGGIFERMKAQRWRQLIKHQNPGDITHPRGSAVAANTDEEDRRA